MFDYSLEDLQFMDDMQALLDYPEDFACAHFVTTNNFNYRNERLFDSVLNEEDSKQAYKRMFRVIKHRCLSWRGRKFPFDTMVKEISNIDFGMFYKFFENPFFLTYEMNYYGTDVFGWNYYPDEMSKENFSEQIRLIYGGKMEKFFNKLFSLYDLFNMTNTSTYEQAKANYKKINGL